MKGNNLPDNVSPNDPDAPWNQEEQKKPETRTFVFTQSARIFYRVTASTPDEASEILYKALDTGAYEDHVEVSDSIFWYHGEV